MPIEHETRRRHTTRAQPLDRAHRVVDEPLWRRRAAACRVRKATVIYGDDVEVKVGGERACVLGGDPFRA